MFRLTRRQLGIFSISRLPMRLELKRQSEEGFNVQKVRLRKRPQWKSLIAYGFISFSAYRFYERFMLDPLADEAMKSMSPEELKEMAAEMEKEERATFFPFPGTAKQLKPIPYLGSDPEWQEFIKFSKDRLLQKRLRDELAQFVKELAAEHTVLSMRCGKDFKLRRCWIDVDFPQHPPPQFERSGIEWSDNAISWVTMPVDSLTVFRLRQILWPSALVQSFWSFGKTLAIADMKRIASVLGFEPKALPALSIDQLLSQHQQQFGGRTKSIPSKDGPPPIPETNANATNSVMKPNTPKSTTTGNISEETRVQLVGIIRERFMTPMQSFKNTLRQKWRPAPDYPPRGSILFSGMVELESTKAYLVFDVRAAWDPKTKAYDARSMRLQLRRFQWKQQGPASR